MYGGWKKSVKKYFGRNEINLLKSGKESSVETKIIIKISFASESAVSKLIYFK